jgi:glucose dehydrogenase
MKALHGSLAVVLLALAFVSCAASLIEARAQDIASASPNGGGCSTASASFIDPLSAPHWNGWGADPTQHRFQPGVMAQLAAADVPHLKLKWAFGFPGATRAVAQPTIIGGRVFVGSQGGKVYSLDAKSGCTYWEFDAGAPVRSAIVVGQGPDGWTAYFGDLGSLHGLGANVHAV